MINNIIKVVRVHLIEISQGINLFMLLYVISGIQVPVHLEIIAKSGMSACSVQVMENQASYISR